MPRTGAGFREEPGPRPVPGRPLPLLFAVGTAIGGSVDPHAHLFADREEPTMTTRRRAVPLTLACLLASTTLTACSDGSGSPATGASSTQPTSGHRPGARGMVTAVNGSSATIGSGATQTTVAWTAATSFRQFGVVSRTSLVVGSCVQVGFARPSALPSSSATPGATASASPRTAPAASATAVSVTISTPVDGVCGSATASTRPRPGSPTAPGRVLGLGTIGQVTAVTPTAFTMRPSRAGMADATFTTSATTLYQRQVPATADAVRVGQCIVALGPTDAKGVVSAKQVVVSAPVNGACRTGARGNR